jgi:chromosome segregation protein
MFQKALTATALIFAVFLSNPAPICVLDEVDAPLDDANLARFNEMIRNLCNRTQFLIITHNKRSMEEADTLYGVTMEEPGASTVVSVKFMN